MPHPDQEEYKAKIDCSDDGSTPCVCSSCDGPMTLEDLEAIGDCSLTPGDASPAGRCPHCDSLAYLDRPIDRMHDKAKDAFALLERLYWSETREEEKKALEEMIRSVK